MGHCRPVAQRGNKEHRILAAAANQLLHGLRAVEDAGGGFGDYRQAALPVGHKDVALVVHCRVKAQVVCGQQRLGRLTLSPLQPDVGSVLAHGSFPQALLNQILDGKLILRIFFRGDQETDAADGNCLDRGALPRSRHQAQINAGGRGGGLGKRAGCGAQENQGENGKVTAHQECLDDHVSSTRLTHRLFGCETASMPGIGSD